MTVAELAAVIQGENATPSVALMGEVTCGYTCDLLSWVMANGAQGMAWITVQTHINVIAVALLMEFSCIILPEGIKMEPDSMEKASLEGIPVLQSPCTAFEICGRLFQAGIGTANGKCK